MAFGYIYRFSRLSRLRLSRLSLNQVSCLQNVKCYSNEPDDGNSNDTIQSSEVDLPKPKTKKKINVIVQEKDHKLDSTAKNVLINLLESRASSKDTAKQSDISALLDDVSVEKSTTSGRFSDVSNTSILGEMVGDRSFIDNVKRDTDVHINVDVVKPEMIAAVDDVAATIGKESAPNIAFDLLNQLLKQNDVSNSKKKVQSSLSDIVSGMTIQPKLPDRTRTKLSGEDYVVHKTTKTSKKFDLFGAPPLGIFSKEDVQKTSIEKSSLFDIIEAEELKKSVRFPPRNSFEEMMQWTEDGKMWQFPIDNEQDIGDEAEVPFHKHVFFDQHLKKFDSTGPVRHFMELVLNGLSKNPYMSVSQKEEHIDWYVAYFKEKQAYLDEYKIELQEEKKKLALEA